MGTKHAPVPLAELQDRLQRFRARMDLTRPEWELAVVLTKVNLYYLTGTAPEGMLIIPRDGEAVLWIRRSYERSSAESLFPNIKPMENYRDAAVGFRTGPATVHLETESVPLALFQRLQKYFPFKEARSLNPEIAAVRAVKSPFELGLMEKSGRIHREVMEEEVPKLLREGVSEAELGAEVFGRLIAAGHHGVARFAMFDTEMVLGHVSFGESSLYPTSFNGAGGNYGLTAATPLLGSRDRTLRRGDLVYMDICCGVDGYHTDKTLTYMFGGPARVEAKAWQARCEELQQEIAAMLKPGAIPSTIYHTILQKLDAGFQRNFMGFDNRRVKFLGHGIGLVVDETPVLADGFDEPLVEGMVFAVEPKKGIPDFGMVGIENTFIVTASGGRSITGARPGLMECEVTRAT